MCDKEYDVLFKAENCQIKSTSIGEVVVEVVRMDRNLYFLTGKIERCCLSNIYESWLWRRRRGHLNFDQIVILG